MSHRGKIQHLPQRVLNDARLKLDLGPAPIREIADVIARRTGVQAPETKRARHILILSFMGATLTDKRDKRRARDAFVPSPRPYAPWAEKHSTEPPPASYEPFWSKRVN